MLKDEIWKIMLVPEGDPLFWKSCFEFCIRDKKSKHASQCQTSRAAPFVLLQKTSPLKALEQLNSQRRLKNWILERCLNNCPTFSSTFQHRELICSQRIYSLSSRKSSKIELAASMATALEQFALLVMEMVDLGP